MNIFSVRLLVEYISRGVFPPRCINREAHTFSSSCNYSFPYGVVKVPIAPLAHVVPLFVGQNISRSMITLVRLYWCPYRIVYLVL